MTRQAKRRSAWNVLGMVLAVVAALGGLVVVGLVIAFVLAINAWGSNK